MGDATKTRAIPERVPAARPRRRGDPVVAPTPVVPVVATALALAGAALLIGLLWVARDVLVLVYACVTLAIGLGRPVAWIEQRPWLARGGRRPPRWAVVVVLYGLALALVVTTAIAIVPPLVVQVRDLAGRVPELTQHAQTRLDAHGLGQVDISAVLPAWVGTNGGGALGTVFGTLTSVLGGLFGLVTIVILTFYLLLEGEALFTRWMRVLRPARRARARAFAARIADKVSAWLVGQLVLSASIGVTSGLAMALLGVPFAYVLGIVAAIGELIPFFGPVVAGASAVAVAAVTVSWNVALAAGGFFLVLQLLENNVLQPKVMSQQVGLSAVTIIVAALLGGSLLGLPGVVLAVPTAAIVEATIEELGADDSA